MTDQNSNLPPTFLFLFACVLICVLIIVAYVFIATNLRKRFWDRMKIMDQTEQRRIILPLVILWTISLVAYSLDYVFQVGLFFYISIVAIIASYSIVLIQKRTRN